MTAEIVNDRANAITEITGTMLLEEHEHRNCLAQYIQRCVVVELAIRRTSHD